MTFEGWVRNHNEGEAVQALEYEAHEEMARDVLSTIADEIQARFGVHRLAIVHRIVTDYQGDIHIDSTPGAGTTVSVRLPARAEVTT